MVAMFAERDSRAVYFLQEQNMTRFDAVNHISHGIAKAPDSTGGQIEAPARDCSDDKRACGDPMFSGGRGNRPDRREVEHAPEHPQGSYPEHPEEVRCRLTEPWSRRQPPLCPNRLHQSRSDWFFFTPG
jgi:hypothetical protein